MRKTARWFCLFICVTPVLFGDQADDIRRDQQRHEQQQQEIREDQERYDRQQEQRRQDDAQYRQRQENRRYSS